MSAKRRIIPPYTAIKFMNLGRNWVRMTKRMDNPKENKQQDPIT